MSHPHVIIDGIAVPIVSGGADEGDPAPDTGGDLSSAAAGMEARLEAGLADVQVDETGAEVGFDGDAPDAATTPADTPDDGTPEEMTYRDAQKLRQEQKEYRERWGPYEERFGRLDDDTRAVALELTPLLFEQDPAIAADIATLIQAYPSLVDADRQIVNDGIIGLLGRNDADAIHNLSLVGRLLRGEAPDDDTSEADDEYDDEPDGPAYVTEDVLEDRVQSVIRQQQLLAQEQAAVSEILAEVRDLGYDLDSEDVREQARVESLFALARRLGSIEEAHAALSGEGQSNVDEFVRGKQADASRPQPPGAAAPASEGRTLETLGDAEAGMNARLDAVLGPQRR